MQDTEILHMHVIVASRDYDALSKTMGRWSVPEQIQLLIKHLLHCVCEGCGLKIPATIASIIKCD